LTVLRKEALGHRYQRQGTVQAFQRLSAQPVLPSHGLASVAGDGIPYVLWHFGGTQLVLDPMSPRVIGRFLRISYPSVLAHSFAYDVPSPTSSIPEAVEALVREHRGVRCNSLGIGDKPLPD
jgi:hypothetical protein